MNAEERFEREGNQSNVTLDSRDDDDFDDFDENALTGALDPEKRAALLAEMEQKLRRATETAGYSRFAEVRPPGQMTYHGVNGFEFACALADKGLEVPEPVTFPEWAAREFYLVPGSSGVSGPWRSYGFQTGVMLMFAHDGIRHVRVMKSARLGFTKILTALVVYHLVRKTRNVVFYQPTDSDAHEFASDEINPLFDYMPSFANALVVDHKVTGNQNNTSSRKVFFGAQLHVKGGKSAANYRRITVDTAILDEIDGFDSTVKGSQGKSEGSPIRLATVRTTDSPYAKVIAGSTPTVKGMSLVEAELEACEEVFSRFVPCPRCGFAQVLQWGGLDVDHGIKWTPGDVDSAHYVCESCADSFTWGEMLTADDSGFWASEHYRFVEEDNGHFVNRASGAAVPTPKHIGIRMSTLISPVMRWSEMVEEYVRAVRKLKLGEKTEMMAFVNTRLGEPFEEFSVETRSPEPFLDRRERYAAEVPLEVVAITAAVDVHIDRFEIEFVGWGAAEECWHLSCRVLIGDVAKSLAYEGRKPLPGQDGNVWMALKHLLYREFRHESGMPLKPTCVFIDSGYLTAEVYKFCATDPTYLLPCKGDGAAAGKPVYQLSPKRNSHGVFLVNVGSDNAMDILHSRYHIESPAAGAHHWPETEEYDLAYFAQMLAERRIKRIRNGRAVLTWVCPEHVRNEKSDLNKYNLAAIKFAQDLKGVNLHRPLSLSRAVSQNESENRWRDLGAQLNQR